MDLIARIFVLMFAYVVACVAASIILTIGTLTPDWDDLTSLGMQTATLWAVIAISAGMIAAIAAAPALVLIALAESFAWRSSLVYAALGGALALMLSYGIDFVGYAGDPDAAFPREREVLAAAGITGGFVYWLFAGRRAGPWKR